MRIIAGTARRLPLKTMEGMNTRPTSDKIKETLFNMLQNDVPGCYFLDLFAGSGAIGIEALSRGARLAVFVDQSRKAQEVIRQNLQHTGLAAQSRVAAMDAVGFLRGTRECFDIALLDPPYHAGLLEQVLPLLAPRMSPGGVILCETAVDETLPPQAGDFHIKKEYRYGKIKLTAYRIPAQTVTEE